MCVQDPVTTSVICKKITSRSMYKRYETVRTYATPIVSILIIYVDAINLMLINLLHAWPKYYILSIGFS